MLGLDLIVDIDLISIIEIKVWHKYFKMASKFEFYAIVTTKLQQIFWLIDCHLNNWLKCSCKFCICHFVK